ncbi:hypothetical protein EC2719100_3300 [Escherichia coli 2719100]|nr:hypothetical protein ECP03018671_3291 [Escherichia coli P0301867.1]EMX84582.1 hypothetical protein EC2719100_3300 [Escherichia coli 2719100]ENA38828.1 hypothetical protein ECP03018674_3010 [Escherichia coli P0301867.4]ENA44304.1 hypothetical protein ECP03018672_3041 [Escherichia coli P0301867.2]ENA60923.1 hypothetical protein EC178900_2945 [Escherichia coli 178900]ENC90454.1 hypothetical protein ECP030186711_3040 [Escherichia coli P0301867.11]ENC94788.1 hypothetical protein ECP03018678_292
MTALNVITGARVPRVSGDKPTTSTPPIVRVMSSPRQRG